jgi:3-hydroxyacyl-[acyl-carrier-protein] dehydratase
MWVDRVTDFEPGRWASAVKNVTLAEPHLHDVAPWYPTLPRTLIIEGVAQTGGILVGHASAYEKNVILAKITRAVFHADAEAGDQLLYRAEMVEYQSEGARVRGTVTCDGRLIGEIDLMYVHLDRDQALPPGAGPSFVFDGIFLLLMSLNPRIAPPTPEADPPCPPHVP